MSILSEKITGELIEVSVQSSNIKHAVFNTVTESLTITFNNGSIYEYDKVPWNKFTKFRMSESQGKYFNEHIGKVHKYKKVS